MDADREDRAGREPQPGFSDPAQAGARIPLPEWDGQAGPGQPGGQGRATAAPADGVRRARRMSNWTLAALIAGTGAATVALAHNAFPAVGTASTATGTTTGATTGTTTGAAATANGTSGPGVSHSVATTSPSGVTTTTTTHVVNGKTVVTHVKSGATYHDN